MQARIVFAAKIIKSGSAHCEINWKELASGEEKRIENKIKYKEKILKVTNIVQMPKKQVAKKEETVEKDKEKENEKENEPEKEKEQEEKEKPSKKRKKKQQEGMKYLLN